MQSLKEVEERGRKVHGRDQHLYTWNPFQTQFFMVSCIASDGFTGRAASLDLALARAFAIGRCNRSCCASLERIRWGSPWREYFADLGRWGDGRLRPWGRAAFRALETALWNQDTESCQMLWRFGARGQQ